MIAMKVEFFYNWDPWKKVRGLLGAVKAGLMAAAKLWHDGILPEHFTAHGAAKYGYRPRSPKYQMRKLKRMGHADPLVYHGSLRDACLLYRHYTGSIGAAGRATALVKMHVGFLRSKEGFNYATSRYRSGLYIPDEISTVAAEEIDVLRVVVQTRVMAFLQAREQKQTAAAQAASAGNEAAAFGEGSLAEMGFGEGRFAA